jgi:hydrogenase maturation protease
MIYVVGIGQRLRGDDEVGLEAVRLWVDTYNPIGTNVDLQVEFVESPGVGLLNLMTGADEALLVDAVQSGVSPGTLHLLDETDLSAFLDGAGSAHGWGVAETLALGRKVDPDSMPERITLIGIEIGQVELGSGISSDVALVLPQAAKLIQETVAKLNQDLHISP